MRTRSSPALGREPVARLLLPPDLPFFTRQRRRVLALCGRIDPDNFDDYLAAGGYTAVSTALTTMRPAGVIRLIEDQRSARPRRRRLPHLDEMAADRRGRPRPRYIICNGDEGDPGAYMDRSVLEGDPHACSRA